jgi:GAF domain-containing protein
MKRRGRASGLSRKAVLPKARKASMVRVSTTHGREQLDHALRERDEALEQVSATSEILKIISKSPGELEQVFDAMLENATRICDAKFATLYLRDGDTWRAVATTRDAPPGYVEARKRNLLQISPGGPLEQIIDTKQVVHIADLKELRPYHERYPTIVAAVELGGFRTCLLVPMLRDDELVGAISILRQEVRPFTDKQIILMENFATQAVIAIENARLLNELRQRTGDLSESLEQQTATSEVLKVISSSPGELKPVFEAMLANATRICEAKFGILYLTEGDAFRTVALYGAPPAFAEARQREPLVRAGPGISLHQAAITRQPVQVADIQAEPAYTNDPQRFALLRLAGARTVLSVPMLKENEVLGVIVIYRQEVRPFTDKQIDLIKNFAAQAVIAIENTRLLNELRQRTDDLSESLEQQTATSKVLQVISSSTGDLKPVFESILVNATRICEASFANLILVEGDELRMSAMHGAPGAFEEALRRNPVVPRQSPVGQVIETKRPVHIADIQTVEPYRNLRLATQGGARTTLGVPMLKDDQIIGAILIYRQEVRPFNAKQVDLVTNFAAQAVIAIENARLLNDLNKLNQQLEQRVTDQVSEIERMGRLRRFLPPQVADLIVASGAEKQLESHRREITALFCDLRGFTGFSESSDPEDVMALLREYHASIGEIINKYGGTLERYAGDGVMVVFNDPIPIDNSALQAALMAIDMRTAIGMLTEKWRKLGHDIGFGIGIAHGFATLGTIGFEGRFDYAAIGTVSNVASRLCDEAKPGQILISPRVLMAVEKDITVEPVGDFALKGIRRPMTAYNVLATKAAD